MTSLLDDVAKEMVNGNPVPPNLINGIQGLGSSPQEILDQIKRKTLQLADVFIFGFYLPIVIVLIAMIFLAGLSGLIAFPAAILITIFIVIVFYLGVMIFRYRLVMFVASQIQSLF